MQPGYEVQASLCRILSITQTKTVSPSGLLYQVVVRASMTLKTHGGLRMYDTMPIRHHRPICSNSSSPWKKNVPRLASKEALPKYTPHHSKIHPKGGAGTAKQCGPICEV
ncbi:hypothetical protein VCV18_007768 [Metarhizium anisopliae]